MTTLASDLGYIGWEEQMRPGDSVPLQYNSFSES